MKHIAMIGAGISGLMSALELLEQGCSVSIFDQQQSGQAASWAGGGILSPMYPWRYPAAVNMLAQSAKTEYLRWNAKLQPDTGIDFQIHETGMLIFDESDFDIGLNFAEQFQQPMQQAKHLHSAELHQLNPHISAQFQQAIYFPQLANVRNPRLLQSILCYLKQHPRVQLFEHCPIERLELHGQQVRAIVDQAGQRYQADDYVLTTGAWSARWAEQLDVQIPVRPVHGQMVLFKTPENWLPTMCMNQVMYLIPRQDGHIVCGSSMAEQGFDTRLNTDTTAHILEASYAMVPALKDLPIVKQWAGLRPGSPDGGIPYIGLMPEFDNLWANFGHFRNGLCMAPASARLLRQLLLGQTPDVSPEAYSPARLQHATLAS